MLTRKGWQIFSQHASNCANICCRSCW